MRLYTGSSHDNSRRQLPFRLLGGIAVRAFPLTLVAIGLIASASAQSQSSLHGTVRDPLGSLVVGASVELLAQDKVVATATTNPDGTFSLAATTSPRYQLRVSAPTFQTTTLDLAANRELDITLATQTLTQQITVTATGTPTPEAQVGASVTVLNAPVYRLMPEIQDPLRLIPGLQVTQVGQMGGTSGLSIRGGATDANKVLIDGVPANAIGGGVEFANLASVAIESIEVLREPNSALYGSDALAGVVSLRSTRASTPLPLFTYTGDAGNLHTYRDEVTAGTLFHAFDLFSAFARIDTSNNLPNSEFHNATYAGNFGWSPNPTNELRFTLRHLSVAAGQPNAIALFGIPDDAQQREQDDYLNAAWNNQTTPRWHNQIRYGGLRQNGQFQDFAVVGIPDGFGDTDGAPVTLTGANGFSVSGQALFYYAGSAPYVFLSETRRDFVYAQTDFRPSSHLLALGAFKYENESGNSGDQGSPLATVQRGNYSYTLQLAGDLKNRLFWNAGTGLEDNGLFGFAATPRASLAFYLRRPSASGLFTGTKLHGSFGKGIKEPSVFQQTDSVFDLLTPQQDAQYHVGQLNAENSRTFDGGLEQQLLAGRARIGVTYFHNQFTNGVEYVAQSGLLQLGVVNAPALQYGAYINSLAFRAQGLELESDVRLSSHLAARAGYTYTDAVVQHSFDSDNLGCLPPGNVSGCTFNTAFNFGSIPIGVYSPLVGARPFRVAPHTGYFSLTYEASKFYTALTGTLVGRRDDSDFLTDSNFGNSLLLPNRNLLGSYQRLELGGGYRLTPRLTVYANAQNLLSQHYYEAFGYPSLPLTVRAGLKLNFGGETWKLN